MPGVARGQDEHSKRFSARPELRSGAKLVGSTPPRAAPLLVAPILFGLALHCRCFRVFDFHPMRRTARPVGRVWLPRDDRLKDNDDRRGGTEMLYGLAVVGTIQKIENLLAIST